MKKFKLTYNAPVTLSFALISLIVLILGYLTKQTITFKFFTIYRTSLLDPLFYVRLFTHVLGHSSLSHYVSNMTLFLLISPMLEEKYGSMKLLSIIAIIAVVTGLVHTLLSGGGLLGASGVVFAFILLSSITGKEDGIPLTLVLVALLYLGNEIVTGITVHDNISQLAHIVGGIVGLATGMILKGEK